MQDRREKAVDELRHALYRLVRQSDLTQRAIEERNGFTRGYLSQVLKGHVTLTARHVLGILFALDVDPGAFFAELYDPDEMPISEIRQRLARYDAALQELEEKGLLSGEED